MLTPLSNLVDSQSNLPNKDPFYKTNRIFNTLFKKNIQIKDGTISKTNINGVIWVNFDQVVVRTVVKKYESGYLLNCNHVSLPRGDIGWCEGQEVYCHHCGVRNAYRNFEHEWSHIIFGSSPALFDRFVQIYSNHFGSYEIAPLIALLVNAFDDIRVNSLWNIVYPGSAGEIEENWKLFNDSDPEINTNLITWLFGVALNSKRLSSGPFEDLIPIAEKALEAVKGRGVSNMLFVIRWFLEQCVDRLINPPSRPKESEPDSRIFKKNTSTSKPIQDKDEAIKSLTEDLKDFSRSQTHFLIDKKDYVSKIAFKVQKSEKTALTNLMRFRADELRKIDIADSQREKHRGEEDMDVENSLKVLRQPGGDELTYDQYLLTDIENVFIANVLPENIIPQAKIVISRTQENDIDRMRAVFAKFLGKKTTRLIEDGDEIDIQSLIQFRLDGQDGEIFEDDGLTKGFAYLTLCDMSQSMEGNPFDYVCQGSEMLKRALDYPFVIGHIWGFRGAIVSGSENYVTTKQKILAATKGGEVWIYKYDPACEGYYSKEVAVDGLYKFPRDNIPVKCGGMTPTHIGLHTAVKFLNSSISSGMEKFIFLVTDGNPTQSQLSADGFVPREVLTKAVRKEIDAARNKGVKIYTTILGDEITEKDAFEMFGPQTFWKKVPPSLIGQALVEMVITQFARFLRQ